MQIKSAGLQTEAATRPNICPLPYLNRGKWGKGKLRGHLPLQPKSWKNSSNFQVLWNWSNSYRVLNSTKRMFHHAEVLVKAKQLSFAPGITSRCWSCKFSTLWGTYGNRTKKNLKDPPDKPTHKTHRSCTIINYSISLHISLFLQQCVAKCVFCG